MLLLLLLIIPLLGVFTISTGISYNLSDLNIRRIKKIALTASIINLFLSFLIFILFDASSNQFQFVQEYHEISSFDFYLGLDGLSIYFVVRPLINIKTVPLRTVTGLTLCKSTNLPDIEMIRGPKHVSKALNSIKYMYLRGEILYIQAFIIMLLQNYNLASKILDTKCNYKCVEKRSAHLSPWLLNIKRVILLKQ